MPPDPNAPDGGGYGAPPPPPPPGYGGANAGWAGPPLATWPERVQANIVDYFGPALVAWFVQNFVSFSLGSLLWLAAVGWGIYNAYLAGQSGQSTGKKMAKQRLVGEMTGQPIGGGAGIGRFFVHILDGIPCGLGFLWPLWDPKKQTWADKIMKTVVVKE
jgi:uncharacterized RDD family membrane protein YckC